MTLILAVVLAWLVVDRRPTDRAWSWLSGIGSRRSAGTEDTEVLVAELTALGLSAGMSFAASVTAAADHVPASTARRLRLAVRKPDGRTEDTPAAGMFALADRALLTGAPLLASIDGYTTALRRDRRAAAIEAARKLPVKLLFPLALLILPGFLLLTVGPALLAGLSRLGL